MRLYLVVIALLVLPGWLMTPLQKEIRRESQQLKYGGQPVTRELRDQIPQGIAIALLAGFRGVAADFIWIRGQGYWDQHMWFKEAECIENTVKLQPQSTFFWDSGAWHMGWNIAAYERVTTNNETLGQGISRERIWHEKARDFLERGIENVPNRYDLYFKLAWLYQQKLFRDCGGDADCEKAKYAKAAEYYAKAASFPHAPAYLGRDVARCLEKAGDARGAYEHWRALWNDESQKSDPYSHLILKREIQRLEQQLAIPEKERMFPAPTAS